MNFKREKGITEVRGIAKSFGIKVGNIDRFNSSNKNELIVLIAEHLKMSDVLIVLCGLPLKELRDLVRKCGLKPPVDLINIHRAKMVKALMDINFLEIVPEYKEKVENIRELREYLMSEMV